MHVWSPFHHHFFPIVCLEEDIVVYDYSNKDSGFFDIVVNDEQNGGTPRDGESFLAGNPSMNMQVLNDGETVVITLSSPHDVIDLSITTLFVTELAATMQTENNHFVFSETVSYFTLILVIL